ncbi:MAG TPA: LysM peptidoglycan-binding domain-containing M23 family metallopeptidase [Anaerolineales bacterium]|nr:LysM peptidoglycan-binding domain-containing M23 family metallopeptidase [Anaerolineales bacterium]
MKPWSSLLLLMALVAGSLAPVGRASAQEAGPIYIVQEGDTLSTIAIRFGTTVEALVQANGIADASIIAPGMQLLLPGFEGVSGILSVHQVAFGESLASLAGTYRTSGAALAKLNRLVNPERLYVGQPAIVPEPANGSPAAAGARTYSAGQGLLEAAVEWGANPWLLGNPGLRLWRVAGQRAYLPGGAGAASDLPRGVSSVTVSPSPLVQGRATIIEVQADPEVQVQGRLGERALNFMSPEASPGTWIALQGIHALQPADLVELEIRIQIAGAEIAHRQPVPVVDGGYGRESLQVPPQTLDPANTGPEDERIAEVVRTASAEKLWEGVFHFPSSYFETFPSRYGTRRSYNGSAYSYYHTGLDLYGNPETPVLAPAPGIVVFAEELTVRGNTTYIDHGWGVYSGFLHQSQIFVHPGDRVETGDTIGMVGATGRVTGAHLHWEIWVGGVPVDPMQWTEIVFP